MVGTLDAVSVLAVLEVEKGQRKKHESDSYTVFTGPIQWDVTFHVEPG